MGKKEVLPNVAKAGVIMMISLLASRFLGIIRDVILASSFGQNAFTDAYRFSFQIPDLLFFLIAGGALSSSFIPVFSEYLHTDREDEAWHVFSAIVCIMSAIVLTFIVVAWILAPQLTQLIAPNHPHIWNEITLMSRIVLPAQYAFFIGGILFGTLYAKQVFTVPGLGPNIYNVGIILGALLVSHLVTPSVAGMSWGALVGASIGNLLIPLFAIRHMGAKFRITFDFSHPGVKKVLKLMLPVVLGLSLPGVFALLLQYFGGLYGKEGVNSALDTANRLMQAPLGIFGQSLAIAAFPALSQFFAQKKMDLFRDQLSKTLRTTLYLAMPISAILLFLPAEIIQALLQHGNFTAADTARTAPALQMFAVGVAAWCMHPVLMRAYFSTQNTITPVVLGTITTVVFIGLSLATLRLGIDFWILPLAGSVSAILLVVMMLIGVSKIGEGIDIKGILRTLFLAALASGLTAFLLWIGVQGARSLPLLQSSLGTLALLGFGFLLFAWGYYFLTKALKMPEAAYFERALKRGKKEDPQPPAPAQPQG
ncbi:MAG: murein biosynthesis integral membrane protein MurJ [Fimbriimonadaceae bacterium]|jgi:putative peptidoglycan lipid II flippase|nr:murein biosynthesis integral membrane protein MurJ [Fimbriimonadaceae bacterium]